MNVCFSEKLPSPQPETIGGLQAKPKTFSFSSSLRRCVNLLNANGQKSAAEQLEMIRSSALSLANLKERKRYYLSLKEEMINILQTVPPQELTELRSEGLEVHVKNLIEISLISSRILHDNPERVYPEHQVSFAALFWQLSKMDQLKRSIELESSFPEDSWKQKAAVDGILAAMTPAELAQLG